MMSLIGGLPKQESGGISALGPTLPAARPRKGKVKASIHFSAPHLLPEGEGVSNASPDYRSPERRKAMRFQLEPKTMAKALRAALQERQIAITHGTALEIVAAQHGLASWNVLAAADSSSAEESIRFSQTCPIIRIFDEAVAKDFYLAFLGFNLDWEHRFGDNFPLYAQVSRAGLTLHLSGHAGDATPGSTVFVRMHGVEAFQQELARKDYKYGKPGLENEPWGLVMKVTDPFSNHIRFCQNKPDA